MHLSAYMYVYVHWCVCVCTYMCIYGEDFQEYRCWKTQSMKHPESLWARDELQSEEDSWVLITTYKFQTSNI